MIEYDGGSLPQQVEAVERAGMANVGIVHAVGQESVAAITRVEARTPGVNSVGNILRRTCQAAGEAACKDMCIRRQDARDVYERNEDKLCADRNLVEGLHSMGIDPEDVLMVAVTGDAVGFGDQLEVYQEEDRLMINPEGWRELPGFNAFFARASEVPAIGSRLADCAHLEFEFKDQDGETVIGFEHGTRPNMKGESEYSFEVDGRPVSYTEYVLSEALRHYGADASTVRIRLSSSIRAENFVKRFDSEEAMESHIPGWYDAGFVENVTKPEWKPGDAISENDVWHADARGLILHDIHEAMERLGIGQSQFISADMLDPADTDGEYSSYQNRRIHGDTRDLYLIAHQSAFKD